VASTGPINTALFLAYGLVKGAFLATEALWSLAMLIAKATTFGGLGALPVASLSKGLVIGSAVMLGSWVATRGVLRLDAAQFRGLIKGMLLLSKSPILSAGNQLWPKLGTLVQFSLQRCVLEGVIVTRGGHALRL
jgi:uncharacterized protein